MNHRAGIAGVNQPDAGIRESSTSAITGGYCRWRRRVMPSRQQVIRNRQQRQIPIGALYYMKLLPRDHHQTTRLLLVLLFLLSSGGIAIPEAAVAQDSFDVRANYDKVEALIPMRDGVRLFTSIYIPKDKSEEYPFLIKRTPYSVAPYGNDKYAEFIGPTGSPRFAREGFIFVYQDVRGRFMSEGTFLNMTPHVSNKRDSTDVDESTDTYDTVEWLLENIEPNNGRAGLWGISYPGFYAAASIIDTHPAIKASSPQAPIADWFVGDDWHRNGAFYLQDAFAFFNFFESPAENPTNAWGPRFEYGSDDAYQFFLDMGPLPEANRKFNKGRIAFWDSLMAHGTYDTFWQRRNILPHLNNIKTNVMTVGGYYDAEDPYGYTSIYATIERNNPGINNTLVLGPWFHGGWVRAPGDELGNVSFSTRTSEYYQEHVDLPFFNYYLKGKGASNLPEVLAFETGSNEWNRLPAWPPPDLTAASLYLHAGGRVSLNEPAGDGAGFDEYISDPAHPVPYTQKVTITRSREYLVEDQRFAATRPDVLVYKSDILQEDLTIAGPLTAELFVSTTGTDADFVVKLIDVFPDTTSEHEALADKYMDVPMAGYQMLVRGEVMRSKFRKSFEYPEPLKPGEITEVSFRMPDVLHTFKAGHRIMIQVQSSWFPLVDRNPQTFVDIYNAKESDFKAATHRVYHSAKHPSRIRVGVMK